MLMGDLCWVSGGQWAIESAAEPGGSPPKGHLSAVLGAAARVVCILARRVARLNYYLVSILTSTVFIERVS